MSIKDAMLVRAEKTQQAMDDIRAKFGRDDRLLETRPFPIPMNPVVEIAEGGLASRVCARLFNQISKYQAGLDPQLDVALRLVSFGSEMTVHVHSMTAMDPNLILFFGNDKSGQEVQLIQHVQQLSFLLTTVKRENPNEERTKFGYWTPEPESKTE